MMRADRLRSRVLIDHDLYRVFSLRCGDRDHRANALNERNGLHKFQETSLFRSLVIQVHEYGAMSGIRAELV